MYVIYDKNKHEYSTGKHIVGYNPGAIWRVVFDFFKECKLYTSFEDATEDLEYSNKFEKRDLQILELVIYKWSCKEILDV